MAARAKRFYLCNLFPLWEIEEENMDVDWPAYHAYFDDLIEMRADIKAREIAWYQGNDTTPHPDLRIRFEVYESDFLLSGGLNDHMGTFSSHASFGDEPTLRPVKLVPDANDVPREERERFIFVSWGEAHETTFTTTAEDGSTSTRTEQVPVTLRVRCWWKVKEEEGGDVSGNPEYYYDVFAEGKLRNGESFDLEERADHELEGFNWHVTANVKPGRVRPIVDGEYALIKFLQMMDEAQHSIHIVNWKIDPQATLVLEHEFHADYLQIPDLSQAQFTALLTRHKPLTQCVAAATGVVVYTASNGNVIGTLADGASPFVPVIQHINVPTNLDWPAGVHILNLGGTAVQMLVVDQWRSRILLYLTVPIDMLQEVSPEQFAARMTAERAFMLFRATPTLPFVEAEPRLVAGCIVLAGNGHAGFRNGAMAHPSRGSPVLVPISQLRGPTDVLVAEKVLVVSDTGNHCLRCIRGFDPADLDTTLRSGALELTTLAGTNVAGDADGTRDAARFNSPTALAWDSIKSRLYIADTGNRKIRAVTLATGAVSTIAVATIDGSASALGAVTGLAFDAGSGPEGTLYISEKDRHRVLALDLATAAATTLAGSRTGTSGYGGGPASSALFNTPLGLAFDRGLVLVADSENRVIRVIETATSTVRTLGSTTVPGIQDVPVVLADVLQRKAKAGVSVRILMDDQGSGISRALTSLPGAETAAQLGALNDRIKVFVQQHEQTAFGRSLGSNHEKMTIVDGRMGITGGIDFAPDKNDGLLHERKHRSSLLWHDVVAFVEGNAAHGLEQHFVRRWRMAHEANALLAPDRTDGSIRNHQAESVRTYDPAPIIEFAIGRESNAVREILESYKRAILSAQYYVYMEHQYIYYPEIGEFVQQAMKDNKQLQVIWTIPFFTEESNDPFAERALLKEEGALASAITDTKALANPAGGGTQHQLRSQIAWHGFFRQHEMVQKFRAIDAKRFGIFALQKLFDKRDPAGIEVRVLGQRIPTYKGMEMIYPHTKMILCDDRFFSIGSANANGRGFTKDGEHNVSALAPDAAKALRVRLWGEHLGFQGVALAQSDGRLICTGGHHLSAGAKMLLRHPAIGSVEREVAEVEEATGAITLKDGAADPAWGRVLWEDPTFADMPLRSAMPVWRRSAHSLATYRKLKGTKGRTNAAGNLVVPGNVAAVGDEVQFGTRIALLNPEGSAVSPDPILQPYVSARLNVNRRNGDELELEPREVTLPNVGWVAALAPGAEKFDDSTRPIIVKLLSRAGGRAKVQLRLKPDLENVPYDYIAGWLQRQPGAVRDVRAWEIDPPEGIEYAGPGSTLFSPWLLLPWLFVDVDPDEQANLTFADGGIRIV